MSDTLFTPSEHVDVQEALHTLTPRRVRRAIAAYVGTAEPRKKFLNGVGVDLERRGLNSVQVQLINVAAKTSWESFFQYLNNWIKKVEVSTAENS